MRINTGCFLNGCKCFDPEDEDGVGIKPDREWQGLTDEEMLEAENGCSYMDAFDLTLYANNIEAKLKEKNHAL